MLPIEQVAAWRSYVNVVSTLGRSSGGPLGGWLVDTIGWRPYVWNQLARMTLVYNADTEYQGFPISVSYCCPFHRAGSLEDAGGVSPNPKYWRRCRVHHLEKPFEAHRYSRRIDATYYSGIILSDFGTCRQSISMVLRHDSSRTVAYLRHALHMGREVLCQRAYISPGTRHETRCLDCELSHCLPARRTVHRNTPESRP